VDRTAEWLSKKDHFCDRRLTALRRGYINRFSAMAQRIGKCTNYSGCKLAYRNEKITVVTKEFRCPECGSPLEPIGPKRGPSATLILTIGVSLVVLLAIVAILLTIGTRPGGSGVVQVKQTPSPILTPELTPTATATASPTPTPTPTPTVTPTPAGTPSATPFSNVNSPEIASVKRDVLKRIDAMPNVSQSNKDRLYSAVDRARLMGLLFTISFETSFTKLSPQDVAIMKAELEHPEIKKMLDDPTLVLVILGYADKQGDDQKNLQISTARAQAVMEALRDQCGVQNVMHVVPMGGTDLLDARQLAKNRVVEVWTVLP
jgi:outer membrane protein OmpA-like peptidoglycan-associated protein